MGRESLSCSPRVSGSPTSSFEQLALDTGDGAFHGDGCKRRGALTTPDTVGDAARPASSHGSIVPSSGLNPDVRRRFERLGTAWDQATPGVHDGRAPEPDPDSGAVGKPRRRVRTFQTPEEVDASRAAKANGESASSLARRFDMGRGTVWKYTRGI